MTRSPPAPDRSCARSPGSRPEAPRREPRRMASMLASNPPQGQAAPEPRLAPLATADQMAELRRRLARLERDYAAADRDRQALAETAREAVQQRDLILGSTLWRLTEPVRQAASWVPAPLRHVLQQVARTARPRGDPAPGARAANSGAADGPGATAAGGRRT